MKNKNKNKRKDKQIKEIFTNNTDPPCAHDYTIVDDDILRPRAAGSRLFKYINFVQEISTATVHRHETLKVTVV